MHKKECLLTIFDISEQMMMITKDKLMNVYSGQLLKQVKKKNKNDGILINGFKRKL